MLCNYIFMMSLCYANVIMLCDANVINITMMSLCYATIITFHSNYANVIMSVYVYVCREHA